jgi:hypothetical protein
VRTFSANVKIPRLEQPQLENSQPVGCPDMVKEMMDEFMVRGSNCPMQRLLNLRARCLRINKQRTAEGVVNWVEDKVFYKDISFDMGQLRRGYLYSEFLEHYVFKDKKWQPRQRGTTIGRMYHLGEYQRYKEGTETSEI